MRHRGLGDPAHHNLWIVQINYYAGRGLFKKIGHVPPKGSQAHIHEVSLWERV